MLRRLIVVTALTAGMSAVATISLATPALAKGPSQASIIGPGLAHAIVLSGGGEPGQQETLAVLAGQTGLYLALFGPDVGLPEAPTRLRTRPPEASLGPRYTVIYTVPGVTQPDEQFGRIRQDLYPDAVGGPVIYTPPGQGGFGQPLQVAGWLRASPQLTRTLAQLGVRVRPVRSAAPRARAHAQPTKRAHEPRPGSSRQPSASQPQQSAAWHCGGMTASQPPCVTANPAPADRRPGQPGRETRPPEVLVTDLQGARG